MIHKLQIFMHNILKKKTETNAGFKINNRGDCELLSELIFEKTSRNLSYNTIRRFFGLAKYMKPNKNTLDTLAKYNGYDNFNDFIIQNPYENYWTIKEKLYHIVNSNKDEIIKFTNSQNYRNKDTIDILTTLCRELIHHNRLDALNEVLNAKIFNLNNFTYEEVLHFGNSVGVLFRNINTVDIELLLNINFLNFVYSIFVDYSNLSKYYGIWSEIVYKRSDNMQMKYFAYSILQLKNYLEFKPIKPIEIRDIDYSNFHPILIGRIVSIQILNERKYDSLLVLNNTIADSKNDNIWDFLFEPIFIAMLSKDFLLMKKIIHLLKKQKRPIQFHHLKHQKLFELMEIIYQKWNSKNTKLDEKINSFNNFKFEYSYKEMLSIFVNIILYHTNSNKEIYLNNYMEITEKFKYPLFNKEYILEYFD